MKLFRWLIFVLCVLRGIRYNSRNACLTALGPSVKLQKPNKELQNDPSCAKCFPHVTSQPQHLSVDLYVPTISPTSTSHIWVNWSCLYEKRFLSTARCNLSFPYAVLNCWSWNPRPTQDFAKGPGAVENHRILIPRQMSVCVSSPHVERVEFAYCFAPNFRMFLLCSPILESCVKGECTG